MASTERKSKPVLGRRSTFQKMLDLEQKNKLDRMQASPTSSMSSSITSTPTPRSPPPPRSNLRQRPPLPLPTIERAMTAPAPLLSLAIPPKPPSPSTSTKFVIKSSGDVVPQSDQVSDPESDISSICQSPGWEDYNGRKRKKVKEEERDRRRREIEFANRQAHQVQTAQNSQRPITPNTKRLSKPPPTHKRLSNMATTTNRSSSVPAVPTLPTMARGDVRKPESKATPEKAKRTSLDVGLRGIMSATQAIPVPWKSSQSATSINNTQEPGSPRRSFSRKQASYNDGGFIGGLKLEQFRQTETIPQIKQEHKKVGWSDEGRGAPHSERDPTPQGAGNSSSSTSMAESIHPVSIYDESGQSPKPWDTTHAQAAATSRGLEGRTQPSDDSTSIMDRNVRRSRKSHPPTSRHFPPENEDSGSSQRDSSNGSRKSMPPGSRALDGKTGQNYSQFPVVSPPAASELQPTRGRTRKTDHRHPTREEIFRKPDNPPSNAVAPIKKSYPPESRGRADYERLQRHEAEMNALRDESEASDAAGSSKRRSRRSSITSFFSRSRSRTRTSIESTAPASTENAASSSPAAKKELPATTSFSTFRGRSRSSSKKDANPQGSFLDEEYVLNQLHLQLNTKASNNAATSQKRASSKTPSFQGFKSAAKSAFSRHSIANPESPTGGFAAAVENQRLSSQMPSSNRASLDVKNTHISSLMKTDKVSTPEPSPINHGFAIPYPKVPERSPARSPEFKSEDFERSSRNATPKALTGSNARSNHSRSATDSSEDYSALDGTSNITTPNASRPQSQKDYFSVKVDQIKADAPLSKPTGALLLPPEGHPALTGVQPFDDAASARDSWCRSAVELEMTENEDRQQTPTGKRSTFDFTTTHMNHSSPEAPQATPPVDDTSDLQRKPSLSRSISTPEMQDLSFLPTLKHQALTRTSKIKGKAAQAAKKPKKAAVAPEWEAEALTKPPPIPIPAAKSEGSSPTSPQSSQYLHNARLAIPGARSPPKTSFPPGPTHKNGPDPIAKMFVVCCQCKYFHDMPSKIYECMAKPDNVVTDSDLGVSGVISTSVKCPWCGHGMGTSCCAGYAAVVYLREKLH